MKHVTKLGAAIATAAPARVVAGASSPELHSADKSADSFVSHLAQTLEREYTRLSTYLGDVRFSAMARTYAKQCASHVSDARSLSQGLSAFLSSHPTTERHGEISELAGLESAIANTQTADDLDVLTLATLVELPEEQLATLTFKLHPACRRLTFRHNTSSIWSALRCGEKPPCPHVLDFPLHVMVWRQGQTSRCRMLGAEEAMALDCAEQGKTFGQICEAMAKHGDTETVCQRAATYLRGWFEAEILLAAMPACGVK